MYLTLETDYAIRIVDYIATKDQRASAQDISDNTGVTLRFSLKILRKLVQTGILKSFKGALGGYELNRPLKDISLHDIIETVEGQYMISRCLAEGHVCDMKDRRGGNCAFQDIFGRISVVTRKMLEEATMDQFINKP